MKVYRSLPQISALVLLGAGLVSSASAQMGGGQGFQIDPTQIRQMVLGYVQTNVGFTDEEWKAIEPRIWKVLALQVDTGTGGLGAVANTGRGGRGGGTVNTFVMQLFSNGKPTQAMKLRQDLQALVEKTDASPQELTVKLAEYRDAVAKAKVELTTAQEDLRSLLTYRQEAILIQMGFLD
jgi:hypothetical protein